jgi:hypothetical protein
MRSATSSAVTDGTSSHRSAPYSSAGLHSHKRGFALLCIHPVQPALGGMHRAHGA